jgi:hypothetical protein
MIIIFIIYYIKIYKAQLSHKSKHYITDYTKLNFNELYQIVSFGLGFYYLRSTIIELKLWLVD